MERTRPRGSSRSYCVQLAGEVAKAPQRNRPCLIKGGPLEGGGTAVGEKGEGGTPHGPSSASYVCWKRKNRAKLSYRGEKPPSQRTKCKKKATGVTSFGKKGKFETGGFTRSPNGHKGSKRETVLAKRGERKKSEKRVVVRERGCPRKLFSSMVQPGKRAK